MPPPVDTTEHRLFAARLLLGFAGLSALWILGTDWLLWQWVQDPQQLIRWGLYKGWLYVVVATGGL